MRIVIAFAVLLLTGCASMFQPSYADLSAAQASAQMKDRSAAVTCTSIRAAGYTLDSVTVALDQNSIKDGGVTGDSKNGCTASVTSAAPPKPK